MFDFRLIQPDSGVDNRRGPDIQRCIKHTVNRNWPVIGKIFPSINQEFQSSFIGCNESIQAQNQMT